MMHWMGSGPMGFGMGHGLFGMIFMILFWFLVIWGIVSLVRIFFPGKGCNREDSSAAIEIARKRYAGGEIQKDEFDRIVKDLQK